MMDRFADWAVTTPPHEFSVVMGLAFLVLVGMLFGSAFVAAFVVTLPPKEL
jgi:hypothetical protein